MDKQALIVGLGLIGGSIAKILRNRLHFKEIAAFDTNTNSINYALEDKTIDSYIDIIDTKNLSILNTFDYIFFCTPAALTCNLIDSMEPYISKDTIVTDVCSTKTTICDHIISKNYDFNFIGGHPMAGSEKSGYTNSYEHLFENAYYILTPLNVDKSCLDSFQEIIKGMGAIPLVMDYKVHDFVAAAVSHLPHIVAFSLVNMIKDEDAKLNNEKMFMHTLAAGGFKDLTRVASSDPIMWENICSTNKENIIYMIDTLCNTLNEIRSKISENTSKDIVNFFNSAKTYRNSFDKSSIGLVTPSYILRVDVVDKVGALAKVTSIIAKQNLNIKNINIENNRELDSGCLLLYFDNLPDYNFAKEVLSNCGFL